MNKKKNYIIIAILLTLYLPFLMVSCNDDIIFDDTIDQLFRPVGFDADVTGVNVTFTWTPIANASYSLEISKDSLSFTTELQVIPIADTNEHIVEGLSADSMYSARIKAVSKKTEVKDSEYIEIVFYTKN